MPSPTPRAWIRGKIHPARVFAALFVVAAFLLSAPASRVVRARAPEQPGPPIDRQQRPRFQAFTSLVVVDASVTDPEGRFVSTLTKDDFEVFEDGRRQTLSTFELRDTPVAPAEPVAQAGGATPAIIPDVRSNADRRTGRVYVLMLDDFNTPANESGYPIKRAKLFIERYIEPGDIAAVVVSSGRRSASQDFTSDKRLLVAAVERFMGGVPVIGSGEPLPGGELRSGDNANVIGGTPEKTKSKMVTYRTRTGLDTMEKVALALERIADRRKAIVYFGPGFAVTEEDEQTRIRDVYRIVDAANRANVAFYPVECKGLALLAEGATAVQPGSARDDTVSSAFREIYRREEGASWLAADTGGFSTYASNNFEGAFERVRQENSSYYLLGYYTTGEQKPGSKHTIEVKVRRPGVGVHARRGYVVPSARTATAATALKAKNVPPAVLAALDNPLPRTDLHLAATVVPFLDDDPARPHASVVIELDGRDLNLTGRGGLDLVAIAVDQRGTIRGQDARHVELRLEPAVLARVRQVGLRIHTRIALPPGASTVRLAVADTAASSRVGSLWLDANVPDPKSTVSLSGVLLTADGARAAPTVNENGQTSRDLPHPPTTRRIFQAEETLAWALEVYSSAGDERTERQLTTAIVDATGREVVHRAVVRPATLPLGKAWRVVDREALSGLQPGAYVLRLEARAGSASAVRENVFTVIGKNR